MSDQEQQKLKVKYENMTALYASQCILNSTKEEILLDFSSGVVPDPDSGQPIVPVHTRVAMSMGGALRLRNLLDKALSKVTSQAKAQPAPAEPAPASGPKITSDSTKKKSDSK